MIIKIVEKCIVSYINEEKKEEERNNVNHSFRTFYYDSNMDTFNDAVADIILNFDVDKAIDENGECEYDGEYLDSLGYISFSLCDE